jgi:hypothetical protein
MIILALVLPASGLSLFQFAVAYTRFTPQPRSISYEVIHTTAVRIRAYMKEHRQSPPSLSVLPDLEDMGFQTTTVDGWGHEIRYSIDQEGIITLTSLGADGKAGGMDRDADVVMRWRTRNADGTLNVDDDRWIGNARVH